MKIRLLAPFLAAMLFFSACSSGTTTTTTTTDTSSDLETHNELLPAEEGSVTGAQVPYTIKYDSSKLLHRVPQMRTRNMNLNTWMATSTPW